MFHHVHVDFDRLPWLTNPRRELELSGVALGIICIPKGEGYTFTHRHREQEEVYIVIDGEGEVLLDGQLQTLRRGDIYRVDPDVRRALHASENSSLTVLCAGGVPAGYPKNPGARYLIDDGIPDYDDIPPWYEGRIDVQGRNSKLKERMERARKKREL